MFVSCVGWIPCESFNALNTFTPLIFQAFHNLLNARLVFKANVRFVLCAYSRKVRVGSM